MEVCDVWLARDFLRRARRPLDIPPCDHSPTECPPIRERNPMNTTVKARTARKAHHCDGCSWTPSLRGVATIAPGHRYLRHVAFPGADGNESGRVVTNT